ncbi:MAG: hypothetical protein ACPKOI_06195 [Pleomorphochaeta sp.]
MSYSLFINNKAIELSTNVKTKNKELTLNITKDSDNQLIQDFEKLIIKDRFEYNEKYVVVNRSIVIKDSDYYFIEFNLNHTINNYDIFIPTLMYKKNIQGKGDFPRITEENQYWSFDETRMPIPGCIEIFNDNGCIIASHSANDIKVSTAWEDDNIKFIMPSVEYPYSYLGKNNLHKTVFKDENQFLYLNEGQEIKQKYFIYYTDAKNCDELENYFDFSKIFIDKINLNPKVALKDYKALLLRHLLFLVEKKDDSCFIKMGKGNDPFQKVYNFTSASFLVKSVEGASIFSSIDVEKIKRSASKEVKEILEKEENKVLENNSYKDLSYKIGDYFLQAEQQEGIFRDCQSLDKNIWGGYLGIGENDAFRYFINSRTNGEALLSYLALANTSDIDHKQKYFKLIDNVISFYINHQLEDGNFGRWWTKDGTVLDKKGTNGAYIFLFLINYYKQTKRKALLNPIKKAANYYSSLIESNNFFGDTLDADSCDKEAGQILLKSFLALYEIEGFNTEYYLNLCKKCAQFIITWVQLDNIIFDKKTPLGKRDFKTLGLTSVSIANQHLDYYGMMIAYDFLQLYKICNEEVYYNLAKYMINGCLQLISNPNDLLERGEDFLGWLPEQINHTKWDYFNNENNICGHYAINIAWVQVLVLDYLDKIENEFPEALK